MKATGPKRVHCSIYQLLPLKPPQRIAAAHYFSRINWPNGKSNYSLPRSVHIKRAWSYMLLSLHGANAQMS